MTKPPDQVIREEIERQEKPAMLTKKEKRYLWRKLSQFLEDNGLSIEMDGHDYEAYLYFKDNSSVYANGLPSPVPDELLGE